MGENAQKNSGVEISLAKGGIHLQTRGSHSKWTHPQLSQAIIIAGKDGSDAKPYLEKQVDKALEALRKLEEPEE